MSAGRIKIMNLGLHDHVSRTLGTDMFGPEAERIVALALFDIYSHRLLDEQAVTAAQAGFDSDDADTG